jgi:hypothetical protein
MPHDDLCPTVYLPGEGGCRCALIARVRAEYTDWVAPGQHDAVVATAEARVRADEQDTKFAQLDHAEAVAAKLVEVICDDEHWRSEARLEAVKHAYAERDAARAEAERLRSPEWEAEVRADERAVAQVQACDFHIVQVRWAEAVAARLVEVVCEQDDLIQIVGVDATNHRAAAADMRRERDAARAEASKYSAEIDRMVRELSSIRMEHEAEVAALREQYVVEEFIDTDGYPSMRVVKGEHVGQNEWAANIRREVLADLRAKAQGLRVVESRVKGRRITVLVDRDDVLALFDGGEDRD